MQGRGDERAHRENKEKENKVSTFSFDYLLDTDWKAITARDSLSKCVFAHAVPQKGVDEKRFVVDRMAQDIQWLGYSKIILKCDSEPATLQVLRETLKTLRVEVCPGEPEVAEQVLEEHPPQV